MTDRYRDVEHLGFIERIPLPERRIGMPVGRDDQGRPIYRPLWADSEWIATRVAATDVERKRRRRGLHLTHIRLVNWALGDTSVHHATSEQLTDWRDAIATMSDLWRLA